MLAKLLILVVRTGVWGASPTSRQANPHFLPRGFGTVSVVFDSIKRESFAVQTGGTMLERQETGRILTADQLIFS